MIIFTALLVGIFTDVSRDSTGAVLFRNYWVAVAMAGFFLVCLLYALLVTPLLKRGAARRASARVKRRPGPGTHLE
jgi:hypothetical protein